VWESLGVSELEERIYRAFLRDPGATLADLVVHLNSSSEQLRTLVVAVERKGLLRRSAETSSGYAPEVPDVAVERLIQRRREEFNEEFNTIRTYLPQLRREYEHPSERERPREFVEIVSGPSAVAEWFVRLQMSATESIRCFDAPPYTLANFEEGQVRNSLGLQRLSDGIQCRTVYARSALRIPGRIEEIRAYIEAGEQSRVLPRVPMKLAIADRRLAMVPIVTYSSASDALTPVESVFMVHQSALMDALVTLFESVWEKALPLSSVPETTRNGDSEDDEDLKQLLALMTAGLPDDVIARQMGISLRTARRRIRKLMDQLDAVSRFQAGLQAAKLGWV
jgi:DNA-binding CsgD family transcriptional regulator/predicted DNA-binding transcriptional regulator